jgi:hypothetical protein
MRSKSTEIHFRRGTKAEVRDFIGDPGELIIATDTLELFVHDGTSRGGYLVRDIRVSSDGQILGPNVKSRSD